MSKFKLSEEKAIELMDQLEEEYEIDAEDLQGDQAKAYELARSKMIKAFRRGRIELKPTDDGLNIVQHP